MSAGRIQQCRCSKSRSWHSMFVFFSVRSNKEEKTSFFYYVIYIVLSYTYVKPQNSNEKKHIPSDEVNEIIFHFSLESNHYKIKTLQCYFFLFSSQDSIINYMHIINKISIYFQMPPLQSSNKPVNRDLVFGF